MSVLVYANTYNGSINKNTFEAVAYANKIASDAGTDVVVVATGEVDGLEGLGNYGASKVMHYNDGSLNAMDPGAITKVIKGAVEQTGADIIVFAHDYTGKSIAPRLSAALDAGLVSGAVDFPDTANGFVVKKAVFSGKAFSGVAINTAKKIVSVLPNSIEVNETGGSATVEVVGGGGETSGGYTVQEVKKESTKLSLTEADVVVSAGRGLKGPENWGMVEELAELMGAATACSRPVADIGWRPHHEHVGQTGIAIRPNLYIAIGISGAIQHLAGVNGSKVIVVINTDAEAPFFKAADYGIVGDAFEVVPKLIDAVKAM